MTTFKVLLDKALVIAAAELPAGILICASVQLPWIIVQYIRVLEATPL